MSFKGRQKANIEILDQLKAFFNENPDQRFCQGLSNVGILNRVQTHLGGQNWDHFYVDEAHTESTATLGRVANQIKFLEEQDNDATKV